MATPLHLQKRGAAMLNLIMQIRELIAKSYKQRVFAETRCFYCETVLLPGERHSFCDSQSMIATDYQCIICCRDERLGDHTECQETIKKFLGFSN